MIRRTVWTSIGTVLIVFAITAAWTQTQQWHGRRDPIWSHHGPLGHIAHALDLSDTQKSQIKSICDGERPNIARLIHELASEQKEVDSLSFADGAPDEGRIQDLTTRQGATFAKLFAEKERVTGKIYSQVLNPTQRVKADELRKHWSSGLDRIADRIGNASGEK
jgi:Spy/CpxP family protein refolding chaperone